MELQHPRHLNTSPVRLELRKQRKWEWSTCSGTEQIFDSWALKPRCHSHYKILVTEVNNCDYRTEHKWCNSGTTLLKSHKHKWLYNFPFFSHLLYPTYRDIKDTTVGTLSQRITNQVHGLKGLNSKLVDIRSYLERVAAGKLPINHQIIYQLQDVFNLLPDVNLLVSRRCLQYI